MATHLVTDEDVVFEWCRKATGRHAAMIEEA
jgi:hypothetical protein